MANESDLPRPITANAPQPGVTLATAALYTDGQGRTMVVPLKGKNLLTSGTCDYVQLHTGTAAFRQTVG